MIAIERYFVFMMFLTATISTPNLPPLRFKNANLLALTQKILSLHNEYRSKHDVEKVDYDEDLSYIAKDILSNIYYGEKIPPNVMVNTGDGKINTVSGPVDEEAKRVFLTWYDMGAGYDYDNEPSKEIAKSAAPFTLIVWKNLKKIGISTAVKDDGTYIIAVVYSKGNKKKQYKKNVFRRKEE